MIMGADQKVGHLNLQSTVIVFSFFISPPGIECLRRPSDA